MPGDSQNGWNEYSKLVLKELETLGDGIESLKQEIQDVKQEMTKMQVREDRMDEIKQWKEKVDDVVSPSQLKTLMENVESLKTFKTKAVTVFALIQFAMAASVWALNMFK